MHLETYDGDLGLGSLIRVNKAYCFEIFYALFTYQLLVLLDTSL